MNAILTEGDCFLNGKKLGGIWPYIGIYVYVYISIYIYLGPHLIVPMLTPSFVLRNNSCQDSGNYMWFWELNLREPCARKMSFPLNYLSSFQRLFLWNLIGSSSGDIFVPEVDTRKSPCTMCEDHLRSLGPLQ